MFKNLQINLDIYHVPALTLDKKNVTNSPLNSYLVYKTYACTSVSLSDVTISSAFGYNSYQKCPCTTEEKSKNLLSTSN